MSSSTAKPLTFENANSSATLPIEQAEDRRIAARHEIDGFAEVAVPETGFLFRGEIANLSEFGCYIKTRAHLDVRRSAQVELRFTLRGDHFSILARAALAKSEIGAGFEFTSIEPSTHKNLLQLITDLSSEDGVPHLSPLKHGN
jgi:PilZ domain